MYEEYHTTVQGYLVRLCGNKELAEELTQEVFFQAVKNIDKFREKSSPGTWLCGIARNLLFSYLKKHKMERISTIPKEEEKDPVEIIIQKDRMMEGQHALHCLPEPYREVFTLRTFCNLTHAQIGGLFGKSEAWARVTYYRARQQLTVLLKEEKNE